MAAAARSLGRPGAADATVALLTRSCDGRPLPTRTSSRRSRAGGGVSGRLAPTCERSADRQAAVGPTERDKLRIGTDIQRRLGVKTVATSRSRASRRCAWAAAPTCSPRCATSSSCAASCASRAAATSRLFLIGRGSDLVISDAGIGGLVVLVRAQAVRIEGERLIADAGLPMAKAATITREAGLAGLEFGLAIPGTVGGAVWANAGAHGRRRRAACSVEALVVTADGSEAVLAPDDLAWPIATAASSTAGAGPARGRDEQPPSSCGPRSPRSSRRGSTRSAAGARRNQPLGMRSAGQRLPQSRRRLGRSAHRRARASRASGGRRHGQREPRQLHRQHAARRPPPTCAAWVTACAPSCAPSAASSSTTRSRSWATGLAGRPPREPCLSHAASRGRVHGRALRRARRLARLRPRHRRGPSPSAATT